MTNLPTGNQEVSSLYRNYVLVMLTLMYVFNFIDRQLLVILQESIKKELHLGDTQLGLLSGFTFAIFYVTMGIPIARLADRSSRRNIVAISLALWSAMTALSGLAGNFIQLLLARIGVGVGEAGGSPPAHAMISDYFPPQKRATALAIYSMGIYFGILIGFVMGGYLNEILGWRTAFFVLGIPGVLFSLLLFATVREPRRGATDTQLQPEAGATSFKQQIHFLYSKKTFVYLALAGGFQAFSIYGLTNWAPSFLSRLHGMANTQIGLSLGLIFGIGGGIGTYAGGLLCDRFGKNDQTWHMKIPAYAVLVSILFLVPGLFINSPTVAIIGIGTCSMLYSMYLGPSIAVAHRLVPASMRAFSSAIFFLVVNLVGLGFGPLTVGALSDLLSPALGVESLRWAMLCVSITSVAAALCFLAAAGKMKTES